MPIPKTRRGAPIALVFAALVALPGAAPQLQGGPSDAMKQTMTEVERELVGKYGESERPRIQLGIQQAATFWRKEDGDEKAFADLVRRGVAADSVVRNAFFSRMEFALESLAIGCPLPFGHEVHPTDKQGFEGCRGRGRGGPPEPAA